jgi:hypothetical protein
MARRKLREAKSKIQGTKQTLTQLSVAAHAKAHQDEGVSESPRFITAFKWSDMAK